MPRGKPFERNNDAAKGGARDGAGRPPDWLKEEILKIGDPLEIIRFYHRVATGEDLEQVVTDSGESVSVPASVKDRLRAAELFLDRAIGKVPQGMEVTGANGSAFSAVPTTELASCVIALRQRLASRPGKGTRRKEGK